ASLAPLEAAGGGGGAGAAALAPGTAVSSMLRPSRTAVSRVAQIFMAALLPPAWTAARAGTFARHIASLAAHPGSDRTRNRRSAAGPGARGFELRGQAEQRGLV